MKNALIGKTITNVLIADDGIVVGNIWQAAPKVFTFSSISGYKFTIDELNQIKKEMEIITKVEKASR